MKIHEDGTHDAQIARRETCARETNNMRPKTTTTLLTLLASDPTAYRREVRRLHTHEPDSFEAFVRATTAGVNAGRKNRRWPLAKMRAFVLGDPSWMAMPWLRRAA